MPRHRGQRHVERLGELTHRGRAGGQPRQHGAAGRIGQCLRRSGRAHPYLTNYVKYKTVKPPVKSITCHVIRRPGSLSAFLGARALENLMQRREGYGVYVHPERLGMERIYRVDGAKVLTSAFAGGPWDPKLQHARRPPRWSRAVEGCPRPADARRPPDRRSAAAGAGRAARDRDRGGPRGPQDPAGRGPPHGERQGIRSRHVAAHPPPRSAPCRPRVLPAARPARARDGPRAAHPGHGRRRSASGMSARIVRGKWGKPGPAAVWFRSTGRWSGARRSRR